MNKEQEATNQNEAIKFEDINGFESLGKFLAQKAGVALDATATWIHNNPNIVKAAAAVIATIGGAATGGIGSIAIAGAMAVIEKLVTSAADSRFKEIKDREDSAAAKPKEEEPINKSHSPQAQPSISIHNHHANDIKSRQEQAQGQTGGIKSQR